MTETKKKHYYVRKISKVFADWHAKFKNYFNIPLLINFLSKKDSFHSKIAMHAPYMQAIFYFQFYL